MHIIIFLCDMPITLETLLIEFPFNILLFLMLSPLLDAFDIIKNMRQIFKEIILEIHSKIASL